MSHPPRDPIVHFWSCVEKRGECWIWVGRFYGNGEARFWQGTRDGMAARFAWEMEHEPIAAGLKLRRDCDAFACVAPAHRTLLTQGAMRKSQARARGECQTEGCDGADDRAGLCLRCYTKAFNAKDPQRRVRVKKEWLARNPGIEARYMRDFRARNPELLRERDRAWGKANRAKAVAKAQRRRALKAGAPGNFTAEEWTEVLEEHSRTCAYCGCWWLPLAQEHVIPLSKGGAHSRSNIVPACRSCNSKKGHASLLEFFIREMAS